MISRQVSPSNSPGLFRLDLTVQDGYQAVHRLAALELGTHTGNFKTGYINGDEGDLVAYVTILGTEAEIDAHEEKVVELSAETVYFNCISHRLQKAAGVDPSKCLSLLTVPGEARTKLVPFFGALHNRRWITPMQGSWRGHDSTLHWQGVRNLHPDMAVVTQLAARIGLNRLVNGDIEDAERLGSSIDFFIDKGSTQYRYECLLREAGLDIGAMPSYDIQLRHVGALELAQEALPLQIPDTIPFAVWAPTD